MTPGLRRRGQGEVPGGWKAPKPYLRVGGAARVTSGSQPWRGCLDDRFLGAAGAGLGALMAGSLGGCAVAAKGDLAPVAVEQVVVVGGGWGSVSAADSGRPIRRGRAARIG